MAGKETAGKDMAGKDMVERYGGRPDKYDNMAGEPKRTLDRIFTLHPTTST